MTKYSKTLPPTQIATVPALLSTVYSAKNSSTVVLRSDFQSVSTYVTDSHPLTALNLASMRARRHAHACAHATA